MKPLILAAWLFGTSGPQPPEAAPSPSPSLTSPGPAGPVSTSQFISTMVTEWQLPRDRGTAFSAYAEKSYRPVLDRLIADGTIVSYGFYENIVVQDPTYSYGVWVSANLIGGCEKARTEIQKAPSAPALASVLQRSFLLRSSLWKQNPARGENGYMWISSQMVSPGKGGPWREAWEKFTKPTYVDLVAQKTIVAFALHQEQAFTTDPAARFVSYLAPSPEGLDNALLGFLYAGQKRSTADREASVAAFADTAVNGSNRVQLMRVLFYATK